MPMNPTGRDLHIDRPLTNVSVAYKNESYIIDDFVPVVPVQKRSDIIPNYDQSAWFRDEAKLRGNGTKSVGSGFTVNNTDTYYCFKYSFRDEISDDDRDNTDQPYNLDVDSAEFVTDKMQLRREVNGAGTFFKTGVWGQDKTGGTDFVKFSDYGNSSPLTVLDDYRDSVEALIGREPNRMILGKQGWVKLKWHPDLIDTIKYTQKGQLSVDLFASLIEIPKVLIGRAIYTTSPEGTAEGSVSYSRIWGKGGLMVYSPDRPTLKAPAAAYTFIWQRVAGALQYIKRMRDEERDTDIIEGNSYFAQKITGSRAGLYLDQMVA